MKVTVAATQMACSWDRDANIANAERLIREAAKQGANIILIQELFEAPYFCKDHLAKHFELALPIADNPAIKRLSKVAAELKVVLPLSVFERAQNAYFNTLVMVDADGKTLGSTARRTSRKAPATTRSSTSRRATRASRPGRRATAIPASPSAGTSGSRRPRGRWR